MEIRFGKDIDWEEQFRMMKRWYYRVRGQDDALGVKTGHQDDYYRAFFVFCYHLKDGLINAGIEGVEEFINNNLYLQLAGDISNYSKHTKLTTTRTGDKSTKAVNQGYLFNLRGPGASYMIQGLEIQSKGKIYDAFEVANKCMDAWAEFLSSKSIKIPEIPEEIIYECFIKWEPKKIDH